MTNDHNETSQRVSVIGLGAMGSGIARTLIEAGFEVSVWNRSRDKMEAMASLGATACHTPNEAIHASTQTVVCLTGYDVWKKIIEDHRLQEEVADKCLIQLTGGTIDDVQEHASLIEANGGRLADGAVMCFPPQLGTADASLLVAGATEILKECDAVLRTLAPDWTNLGEDLTRPAVLSRALTSGIVTSLIGFVNSIAICQAGDIPLDLFMQHIDKANDILPAEKQRLLEAVRDGRTEQTQASITTWAGAHQTIHSVAGTLGTNLLLQDAVKTALQEGERLGLGDHDLAALVKVFANDQTP